MAPLRPIRFLPLALAALGFAACTSKKGPDQGSPATAATDGAIDPGPSTEPTCAKLALTDPANAPGTGSIAFHLDESSVDPCSVTGYVVGDQTLTVQNAGDGNYIIANVPPGNHDVILQGKTRPERVGDPSAKPPEDVGGTNLQLTTGVAQPIGLRVNDVVAAADKRTAFPGDVSLQPVGEIAGIARLEGQTAHNGILVVIPGTGFNAFTADDGTYLIANVVPGDHDLDLSKDQYFPARIGALTVEPAKRTTIGDVLLRLNQGESGPIVGAASDVPASLDLTYDFTLVATGHPVKMKVAFEPDCPNVEWSVFKSYGSVQLPATAAVKKGGYATFDVYVCIADRDNTASTLKQTVTVDIFGNHGVPTFNAPDSTSFVYGPTVKLTDITTSAANATMRAFVIDSLGDEAAALALPGNFNLQSSALAASMAVTLAASDFACTDYWIYFYLTSPEGYESHVAKHPVKYACWHQMNDDGRPNARVSEATVRWAGDRLVVFGDSVLETARSYDPAAAAWHTLSATARPSAERRYPYAFWTGQSVLVFGGKDFYHNERWDGGAYRPEADAWTAMPVAPSAMQAGRVDAAAYWVGDRMLLYGGDVEDSPASRGAVYLPQGAAWHMMSVHGEPSPREDAVAIWTGSYFLVWGGQDDGGNELADGGRYDPLTNTWLPVSTTNALPARYSSGAAVVGSKILIFGGYAAGAAADAKLYDPTDDTWTAVTPLPDDGYDFSGVFAVGGRIIVWDGYNFDDPIQLDLSNGPPGTWSSVLPAGCSLGAFTKVTRVVDKIVAWPPICAQKYAVYDPQLGTWSSLPGAGPEPTHADSRLNLGDAGGRLYVYEVPYTADDGAYGIGALGRTPLTVAWVKPNDRTTNGVRPGETVSLGYRIVNDRLLTAGGTLRIKDVSGAATIAKATANLPALGANETRDVPAADSVAVAVASGATAPGSIVVTLEYETAEGYRGESVVTLPISAPHLAVTDVNGFGLGAGQTGSVDVTITNTGTDAASDVTVTASATTCLTAAAIAPVTTLAAGASVVRTMTVTTSPSGCAGLDAVATLQLSYKSSTSIVLNKNAAVRFAYGSFRQTLSDATTTAILDNDSGNPVIRTLAFPAGSGTVAEVAGYEPLSLKVTLAHTAPGDLVGALVAPDGTRVGPLYFDGTSGSATPQTFTFNLSQSTDLAVLLGEDVTGTNPWTFEIYDNASADTGSITAVELTVVSRL